MLSNLLRLTPLLVLAGTACQGTEEYAHEPVSISPRLGASTSARVATDPAPSSPAARAAGSRDPRGVTAAAPPTTPGKAYASASSGTSTPAAVGASPISTGLVPLSAHQDPSSPRVVKRGARYEIEAGSGKDRFTWVLEPQSGGQLLDVVSIRDDGAVVRPFSGANTTGAGKPKILDQRRVSDGLEVTYDNDLVQVFTPVGRSLRIDLTRGGGLKRGRLEFLTGGALAQGDGRLLDVLRVPYFDLACVAAVEVDDQARFLTAWLDPMVSNATQILASNPDEGGTGGVRGYAQNARYHDGTDGRRRPLRERIWVTWGAQLDEALPSMDRPASPARAALGEHFYVSYTNVPFDKATADVETLYGLGLEDLQFWMHHWQKDGYDQGYPNDVMPPRRVWGGLAGLRELIQRSADLGYGMGVHHNWLFNSLKKPGDSHLGNDGRIQANVEGGEYLKHRVALALVDEVEGEFHDELGTRGTFSDSITTGFPPVDLDSDTEDWGLVRAPVAAYLHVMERLREIHGSPSAGEGGLGGGNVLYAGTVDAMPGSLFIHAQPKATNRNGRFVDVLPHFALGGMHELSVRAGIGPPRRFVAPDRWTMAGGFTAIERDLTRTMTVLLGNAGYHWWYQLTRPGTVARDWWSGREAALALARPGIELTAVTYEDESGRVRDLEQHLLAGGDLSIGAVRVHLTFADGVELWANLTQGPWKPKGQDETLAPMGHLLRHGEVLAGILVRDGATVQVSTGPKQRWLDGRGRRTTDGGITTNGAVGLRTIDPADGGGWHVFPMPDYTLALPRGQREQVVDAGYVELGAPYVGTGTYQLVFLDERRLEVHAEVRELGADGLRLIPADLSVRGAASVRVQPMD